MIKKSLNGMLAILGMLGITEAQASYVNVGIEFEGLEPMSGQHYEGWDIVNGSPLSTGRFAIFKDGSIYQVDASGKAISKVGKNGKAVFSVEESHLNSSVFVLTVEPNGDKDPSPSDVHVMGGDFSDRKAQLSLSHGSSFGTDFETADGQFILAAPTGGAANKGVWFIDPAAGTGSLTLPEIPDGWAYEGWIVNTKNGAKYSTGLFKSANGADSDNAGHLAGPLKLDFPRVPGQDIVASSVVLDDGIHAVVVSVEPYPDYDREPYAIKILMAGLPKGAPGMTPIQLANIADSAPKGLVHLH